MKNSRVERFIKDPKKALLKLSLPIIVAMLVQTLYNIVDTIFVGRLGTDSIAALSFSFPLFFLLISIVSGIGSGVSSLISRFLGAKDKSSAENTALHGILLSICAAVIIYVLSIYLQRPLFNLFGATESVLALSMDYMTIIFFGVFFMFPSYTISNIFSGQGDTKTPMRIQMSVLIINIILDPIFIYGFKMGVKGAALATVISFAISLILFSILLKNKSHLKVKWNQFKFSPKILKGILSVGLPAGITMVILSLYVVFINKFMAHYGTDYVAAFGMASRLENLAVMPIVAISMSLLTLVGMYYGAKRYDLVKFIIWYGIRYSLILTGIVGILLFVFPEFFFRLFTDNLALLKISVDYMRVVVLTFPLMAIVMVLSRSMQGMGYGLPGLMINLTRLFLAVPLAGIFVYILNYNYLFVAGAMVIGGAIASIVAIILVNIKIKKIENKISN